MTTGPTIHRLAKHHGLGNDFLVLLGAAADLAGVGPDQARSWCHRRTGIGADGLLLGVTDGPADLGMTLYNADGSVAEMSGNGIRCLAQAEVDRRGVDRAVLDIDTGGGRRHVTVEPGADARTVVATVDMGEAGAGPTADRHPAPVKDAVAYAASPIRSLTVDMGNPHIVLLVDDPTVVDVEKAGPHWEAGFDAGINVHAIAPTPGETDDITMAIWERGAGATLACGTGATAAAFAAHSWGLVGNKVRVRMPGGEVEVVVGDRLTLHGPAARIATVEVEA